MLDISVDKAVSLCLLEEAHADELFALIDKNRNYLRQWFKWVDITHSVVDIKHYIRSSTKNFGGNYAFDTGVWVNQHLAGVIGFSRIDWANSKADLSFWLAPDFQGKGVMTKAVKIFVDYGFQDLCLNRIEVFYPKENESSHKIAKSLGFQEEGTIRQSELIDGKYIDIKIFGILSSEWQI